MTIYGVNGAPLSYTMTNEPRPVHEADDQSTSYLEFDGEMVAHTFILDCTAAGALHELEKNCTFVDTYMTVRTTDWDKTDLIFQEHE